MVLPQQNETKYAKTYRSRYVHTLAMLRDLSHVRLNVPGAIFKKFIWLSGHITHIHTYMYTSIQSKILACMQKSKQAFQSPTIVLIY